MSTACHRNLIKRSPHTASDKSASYQIVLVGKYNLGYPKLEKLQVSH